jgi:hypothetical protein
MMSAACATAVHATAAHKPTARQDDAGHDMASSEDFDSVAAGKHHRPLEASYQLAAIE